MERDRRERPKAVETPGQVALRLINQTVAHTLTMRTSDPSSEEYARAQEGLVTNRDEFRAHFVKGDGWDENRKWWFNRRVQAKLENN